MRSSDASVTVRLASRGDEATVSQLAARLADFGLPRWRVPEEISSADARAMSNAITAAGADDQVFIAERHGQAVGCLHVLAATDFFGRRHAHISVIAVTAVAEGTGVGNVLVAHAEKWAQGRGFTLVTLNVFAENARARRLYERHGFVPEIVKYAKPIGDR
jgi:ribosomal protein S18 acetylase RimI-like enzyme